MPPRKTFQAWCGTCRLCAFRTWSPMDAMPRRAQPGKRQSCLMMNLSWSTWMRKPGERWNRFAARVFNCSRRGVNLKLRAAWRKSCEK